MNYSELPTNLLFTQTLPKWILGEVRSGSTSTHDI